MTQTPEFAMQDPWRVFGIMSEFVEGFETMGDVGSEVSVFGRCEWRGHPALAVYPSSRVRGRDARGMQGPEALATKMRSP